jgi:hypothetical protein
MPADSVVKELRPWLSLRRPIPDGAFEHRTENKKPGVERRANSSTHIGRICAMLDSLLSGIRKRPRSESGEGLDKPDRPLNARQVPSD